MKLGSGEFGQTGKAGQTGEIQETFVQSGETGKITETGESWEIHGNKPGSQPASRLTLQN